MPYNKSLKLFYSKSTAVADDESGHDHLGGRISADQPVFLRARSPITMKGVTIGSTLSEVPGKNLSGTGRLVFVYATKLLSWKAPRDTSAGTPVNVSAGGTFYLTSSTTDAWIQVNVTPANLPSANTTEDIVVDSYSNILFDDVSTQDAMLGTSRYRCFFAKNTSGSPLTFVRPVVEMVGVNTGVQAATFYPESGAVRLKVTSAYGWPNSSFIRNVRTREILYYTARSGGAGNELIIPTEGRRRRGTASAEGIAADTVELISPIDIFTEEYSEVAGAAVIMRDDIAPIGASFFYPDPTGATTYPYRYTLSAGSILTVWLRRNTIPGATEAFKVAYRLSFLYEV